MQNNIVVVAFYKFATLPDYQKIQPQILATCKENEIQGTILLAAEGINGTIAGSRQGINTVLASLRADSRLVDLEHKESFTDEPPFERMKVKLRNEIVALGRADVDPNKAVGTYVKPQEWNDLISDPNVMLIDTRNQYEVSAGTFDGAINPHTDTFREFPEYAQQQLDPQQHKKIAMFCTGGIRCEKASSLLLNMGFEEVYHLQGGILKYLEEVPQEESQWQGECFVFDNRITVNHKLEPGDIKMCLTCHHPLTDEEMNHPEYHARGACVYCADDAK